MKCDPYIERFGDVVDGTLAPGEKAQIDAHCRTCESCRDLLNDLIEIRAAAATLDRVAPSPDVWTAIVAKVRPSESPSLRRDRRAFAWLRPGKPAQRLWIPVAAALLIMMGAATWLNLGPAWTTRNGRNAESAENAARTAVSELQLAERHYENAIRSLEQLTISKDTALDPAVVADIAQSLQSIDRAITDSRAALRSEPGSFVAQTSLLEALRMKVALLQETVSLMNARS